MTSPNGIAVAKLLGIIDQASKGSTLQNEAILALGRAGGITAAKKLVELCDKASEGSTNHKAIVRALGFVGRAQPDDSDAN